MQAEQFEGSVDGMMEHCRSLLIQKNVEYSAGGDKVRNFRRMAAINDVTIKQALSGVMVKHSAWILDAIKEDGVYPLELWREKIGDEINYLLILKAILDEEADAAADPDEDPSETEGGKHQQRIVPPRYPTTEA